MLLKSNLKTLRLTFFILLSVQIFFAQNNDTKQITYLDKNENPTSKDNAVYYEFRTSLKPGIFKYQKYFLFNYKAYLIEKYFYDANNKKQGKYTSYFRDGVKKEEGIYKDDLKYGPWKEYAKMPFISLDSIDNSTYLSEIKYYKNNIKQGRFKDFYEEGSLLGEGEYLNDHFFGECKWYYRNGQISLLEVYDENGKLTDRKRWDEDGKELAVKGKKTGMTKNEIQKYISSYIKRNFDKKLYKKYPDRPYGKIYIQFVVDKAGNIILYRIKSTYKVPKEFVSELIRIFKTIPQKEPIYNKLNQPVRVVYTLPFSV